MEHETQEQSSFEGWGIVEVLGRRTYAGYVKTEAYGQAVMFRIDVPALEERERVTKAPEVVGNQYVPAGTTVKEGPVDGYTKLVGSGSIYCLTPCTKEAVLKAIENSHRRPLMSLQLPAERALEAGKAPVDGEIDAEEVAVLHGAGESDNGLNDDFDI